MLTVATSLFDVVHVKFLFVFAFAGAIVACNCRVFVPFKSNVSDVLFNVTVSGLIFVSVLPPAEGVYPVLPGA